MLKIEAVVREEKLEDVKEALHEIDVNGITVFQVMGCGAQKGYTEPVHGQEIGVALLPKVKFEIIVSTKGWAEKTIQAIQQAAFTGNMGDGKIFVYDIDNVVRIRTGEEGCLVLRGCAQ